jgi:UPF0176 protein
MYHVLLFYKFIDIENVDQVVKEHRQLCESLGLKGRILISDQGLNGTAAGTKEAIEAYKKAMNEHQYFSEIDFKESTCDFMPFPRLQVKEREEVITTGVKHRINLSERGQHVDRDTFHQWLVDGEDMVILDLRNDYEWEVGRFRNAIRPPMKYFRDIKEQEVIDFYKQFKGKKIVMYCTGGIRCEPASAFLINECLGYENVYQLEGGVVKYAEKYANDGFFEGKCYVFDERIMVDVDTSPNAKVVGKCAICANSCDIYRNCANKYCNKHFIACDDCNTALTNTCSEECKDIIANPSAVRPPRQNDLKVLHRNK